MKFVIIFFFSSFFSSCSTFSKSNLSHKEILFTDLQEMQFGAMDRSDLEANFGPPNEEFLLPGKQLIGLGYLCKNAEGDWLSRANFVVQKDTGKVLSVMWIPKSGESLKEVENAKAYFKGAKFNVKRKSWIPHKSDPDEVSFSDPIIGVSISAYRQVVLGIGFSAPSSRLPATSSKQ